MNKRSDDEWDELRAKVMGFGKRSVRKSYYPELQEKLNELERFKALLDEAKDIIFLVEIPYGQLVDVSRSASRQLGYTRDELLGMTLCDLTPPLVSSWMREFWSNTESRAGCQEVLTTALTRVSGEALPVEMTLRLVTFQGSSYAVVVARDITARKRALDALKESEERHRALVESSSDAILMVNRQRLIVSCNQAFLDLFGFRKEEVVGQSARIIHPTEESFHAFVRAVEASLEKSGSFRTEWELMRRDGFVFPVEETVSPVRVRDEDGETGSGAGGSAKDDEEGGDAEVAHGDSGKVDSCANRAEEPDEASVTCTALVGECKKAPYEIREGMKRASDESIRGFVAIIRDVSERKKAEDELERYRSHLEEMVAERTRDLETAHKALLQREKLRTLGAISAELAHELRNPLVAIGGFAVRLQKKFPEILETDIILKESQRLEQILDRIKHYLKPVDMLPEECSVGPVLVESVELLSPELEREGVALRLDLAEGLSGAYVDSAVLLQVFVHMIRDAVKDTDKHGRLTIRTFEGDQQIYIEFRNPVSSVEIHDPGLPFLPLDEGGRSTMVPLCFRLLKDMGGSISWRLEEEDGSGRAGRAGCSQRDERGAQRGDSRQGMQCTMVFSVSLLKAIQREIGAATKEMTRKRRNGGGAEEGDVYGQCC